MPDRLAVIDRDQRYMRSGPQFFYQPGLAVAAESQLVYTKYIRVVSLGLFAYLDHFFVPPPTDGCFAHDPTFFLILFKLPSALADGSGLKKEVGL
jgi:hypothetical protein